MEEKMGNICAQGLCGVDTADDTTTVESSDVRLDSPKSIIRRVEVESIVKQRELTKLFWSSREVIRWLDLMDWGRYKVFFLEKNVDGESLADIRPLTLVRDFSVEPIDAFPLFNDISPLFRSGEFRVKDFDLEFRRIVDLSMMEKELDKRISRDAALKLLGEFRGRDIEASDPALQYFVGIPYWDFLRFLRRPPTPREQGIIRGDHLVLPLPQKTTHIEVTLDDSKEDIGSVDGHNGRGKSALEKSSEIRLEIEEETAHSTLHERPSDKVSKWATEVKEPLSLEEPDQSKLVEETSGYLHDECPICLTPFDEGRDVMALPCAHLFCQRCITDWLSLERSCPICQMNPDDEELTMALLDSAFMACSMPNLDSSEKNLINEQFDIGSMTGLNEDEISSLSRGHSGRRSSYHGPSPNYAPCALCQGPVNVSKNHVQHKCGHVFHKRCGKASGHRGGCPFCSGPQARANDRNQRPVLENRNQPVSSRSGAATVWQVRKHSRWVDLPPNVGYCLDAQMNQRRPTTEVVVLDEKRYEIRAQERRLVDLSHKPPRTHRIRKLQRQAGHRSEPSCSVM